MFNRNDLKRLILPLVVEQILLVTVGMADTVMVSSCGQEAVSAISLVDSINILLINIFSALGTGGAIVAAQYLGRDDEENAGIAARQLLMVVAVVSLLITALSLMFNGGILRTLFGQVEPAVMSSSRTYFYITALSYPFLALYNAGAALFRAMGNSRMSMYCSVLMNLINIGGNAVLIFGFGLGVAGAAIPTLLSRAAAALTILWFLSRQGHRISVWDEAGLKRWRFHPTMVKSILGVGVPNGLENGMFQVGKIMVQGLIASLGTAALAANAMANNVASLAQVSGGAVGLAMVTVVGQTVGAGRYDEARGYILKLTGVTYLSMGVLNLTLLLAAAPLVSLFGLPPETTDMAVQLIVACSAVSIVLWPGSFTLPNGLRAAGDVRFTMTISTLSMWVFRVGCSFLFVGFGWGIMGVWAGMFVDWLFRICAFLWRFLSGRWQNHAVI